MPASLSRPCCREPGPRDIAIDILHCGVCHSNLHAARGEWAGGSLAPGITGVIVDRTHAFVDVF